MHKTNEFQDLPVFILSARPEAIPLALLALPYETPVRRCYDIGGTEVDDMPTAGVYVEELISIMRRQSKGYFTINEAAQVLADAISGDVKRFKKKLERSVNEGKLTLYDPDDLLPVLDLEKTCNVREYVNEFELLAVGFAFPAMPLLPSGADDTERPASRKFRASMKEHENNGGFIDWRYWVEQMPTLKSSEAARLMSGLDPIKFFSLESPLNNHFQRHLCANAVNIERLANRQSKDLASPAEWMTWAVQHEFEIDDMFKFEVAAVQEKTASNSALSIGVSASTTERAWKEYAQKIARKIIMRDKARDLYPSQIHIAEEIAKQFRDEKILGTSGKPLTAETIKRHALDGITSAQGKQFSIAKRQGE